MCEVLLCAFFLVLWTAYTVVVLMPFHVSIPPAPGNLITSVRNSYLEAGPARILRDGCTRLSEEWPQGGALYLLSRSKDLLVGFSRCYFGHFRSTPKEGSIEPIRM